MSSDRPNLGTKNGVVAVSILVSYLDSLVTIIESKLLAQCEL